MPIRIPCDFLNPVLCRIQYNTPERKKQDFAKIFLFPYKQTKPRDAGLLKRGVVYACSAMVYKSFSVSAQPKQGSVMDLP